MNTRTNVILLELGIVILDDEGKSRIQLKLIILCLKVIEDQLQVSCPTSADSRK
jgi:hypothetical protein